LNDHAPTGPVLGRTALVTGASRGIGRAIALKLGSNGYHVAVGYHADAPAANRVVAEIAAAGSRAAAIPIRLEEPERAADVVERVVASLGSLDVYINNAGVLTSKPFLDVSIEEYDQQANVNIRGSFFLLQAAARRMSQSGGGKIIVITSDAASRPFPDLAPYCSTKAALRMLVRVMAKELAANNVVVNEVAPGTTQTDMNQALREDLNWTTSMLNSLPLGRLGEPEDIANVVSFLASPECTFMTGGSVAVDGGSTLA
jgi:3-oxoacyl-[acyl-carrier protein] reductase